jgi:glycosyltransferase 2 family protein
VIGRLLEVLRRRRVLVTLQIVFLSLILGFLGYALRDAWADALPRLRDASLVDVGAALGVLAAYYLLFVVGWQWILREVGVRVGYDVALQAEMASMLAKYVPGGVWTPLARILWLRRVAGVTATSVVLGSILLEAGLSAIAGVLVFATSLVWVDAVDAPLAPLAAFAAVIAVLVHPRVFSALARLVFRRFGWDEPAPLPFPTMLALLVYYAFTWLVGGAALFFLVRAVGGDPRLAEIPYLGGAAAVGAIVAVLVVIAPSGLGVREASMYGLLLAVMSEGVALGATVLNRLAITLVEAVLLAFGILLRRRRKGPAEAGSWPKPELARRAP